MEKYSWSAAGLQGSDLKRLGFGSRGLLLGSEAALLLLPPPEPLDLFPGDAERHLSSLGRRFGGCNFFFFFLGWVLRRLRCNRDGQGHLIYTLFGCRVLRHLLSKPSLKSEVIWATVDVGSWVPLRLLFPTIDRRPIGLQLELFLCVVSWVNAL